MEPFHLAIPTHSVADAKDFYHGVLGATIGREYEHYVIFDFFGHQLVSHLDPEKVDKEVQMYPRHFGIIFKSKEDLEKMYQRCKVHKAPFFEELFERYQHKHGWHFSFFVIDPSNNLVEFKYYVNPEDVLG